MFFQGKQRVIKALVVGGLASLALTFGLVAGGWITDNWSWHWLFYINIVPGILVAVLVPPLVDIDRPNLGLLKGADYLGIGFMALFLGCLEYVLNRVNLHFERTAEHLTAANVQVMGLLDSTVARYTQTWGDPAHAQTAALKKLRCWRSGKRRSRPSPTPI